MAEYPKDPTSEPEGAPTELDVKLPSKIALAHAEETLEQRTTLPRVPLPSRREILLHTPPPKPRASTTGPHALPPKPPPSAPRPQASTTGPHPLPRPPAVEPPEFDPQSYPPLDAEFFRPTETVRTPKFRRGGTPWIVLMLLGVVLGTGVTILLLRWLR